MTEMLGMWMQASVVLMAAAAAAMARGRSWRPVTLGDVVPADGIEPPTNGLQNRCSTN